MNDAAFDDTRNDSSNEWNREGVIDMKLSSSLASGFPTCPWSRFFEIVTDKEGQIDILQTVPLHRSVHGEVRCSGTFVQDPETRQ